MVTRRLAFVLFAAAMFLGARSTYAQGFTSIPWDTTTGVLSNNGSAMANVWQTTIHVPGALSLRLNFDVAELDHDEDRILVWNVSDNVQPLSRLSLKSWGKTSAYFNGDAVEVALALMPGSVGQLVISRVDVQYPPAGPDTLCAGDDRSASSDDRVCRLVNAIPSTAAPCTGFLISASSAIASAGHCNSPAPSAFGVAEFRVPSSTSAGGLTHALVADQFPVDESSIWLSPVISIGADYAVMRLHPNSLGETAAARYGYFTLAASVPLGTTGYTVRVTGYGSDTTPLSGNYTQQTATGPIVYSQGSVLRHQVDTMGGNSGSPIIRESTGEVYGIHTNGGCDATSASYNSGTSIRNTALQGAISVVSGCASIALSESTGYVDCTPTVFSAAPAVGGSGLWSVVGVSSTHDWDISVGTTFSAASGSECDFLVANGHLGSIAPVSGLIHRGLVGPPTPATTTPATAEQQVGEALPLGEAQCTTFLAGQVIDIYELSIVAPGPHQIVVGGSSTLRWRLFAPGTSNAWRSRTASIAAGTVGGGPATVTLSAGIYALVVARNGGPSATALPLNIYVGPASTFWLTAFTSGAGAGDLCLHVGGVPATATHVIILVSSLPGGGMGPIFGLLPTVLLDTVLMIPPTPFDLLHFPAAASLYLSGPVSFPAPALAALAGQIWEARAVAYNASSVTLSGLSPIRALAW